MDAAGPDVLLYALRAREILPGTNQASVFAIGIAFSVIAISVMSLRIYCRPRIIGCGLGADDCESHPFYIHHFLASPREVVLTDDMVDLMLVGVICSVGQSIANMVCESSSRRVSRHMVSLLTCYFRRLVRSRSPRSVTPLPLHRATHAVADDSRPNLTQPQSTLFPSRIMPTS